MRPSIHCALLALAVTVPATAAPDPKKPAPADEAAQIANKLLERIDVAQRMEGVQLKVALEFLQEKIGVTVLLDTRALLSVDGETLQNLENKSITLPAMKRVRAETVLRQVVEQIDADYYIAPDHVRITTVAMKDLVSGQARPLADLYNATAEDGAIADRKDVVRTAGHVTLAFRETSAADAMNDVAARAGRTVVVSGPAAEKAKALVTLSLANVPFETAVAVLAEAAGLRAFRTGNVVVVVTPERAKQVEGPEAGTRVALGGLSGLGGIGTGGNVLTLEELESVARVFGGKAADGDGIRRELEKQRLERTRLDAERAALEEKVQKLTAELEKLKKK